MALSRIDTTNMIEDVPQSKLDNNINFRNIIINGDMSIAQRGTSFAGVNDGDYTLDRFLYDISGTDAYQFTISQSTDVPTGQGFAKSMKFDCTTADTSLDADNYALIHTRLEGQNLQYLKKGTSNASSLTLSFWVKSNKTGTYIAELQDNDNNRVICKSYTISASDTWEKKTITYAGDTSGAFDNDNGNSLKLNLWLLSGTQFSSGTLATSWESRTNSNRAVGQVNLADSTSNEWYITGVQLEAGTTASDFEFLPVDVNLTRCERYYQTTQAFICAGHSTSGAIIGQTTLRVKMRSTPSASQTGNFIVTDGYTNDYTQSSTNITRYGNNADTSSFMIYLANFNSAMTAAKPYFTRHSNDSVLNFSSEL